MLTKAEACRELKLSLSVKRHELCTSDLRNRHEL